MSSPSTPPLPRRLGPLAVLGAPLVLLALFIGSNEPLLGVRLPDVRDALGVSEAGIGAAWAPFSIGLLGGSAVMAAVVGNAGTRRCMLIGAVLCASPLIGIGAVLHSDLSPTWKFGLFMALWLLVGIGHGVLDPAHAAAAAMQSKRPDLMLQTLVMSKSVGLIAAAALGALASTVAMPVTVYLGLAGIMLLAVGVPSAWFAPDLDVEPARDQVPVRKGTLVVLGFLAAAAVVPLGASVAWATSVLEDLGAPVWFEVAGLFAFAVAQLTAVALVTWRGRGTPPARLVAIAVCVAGGGTLAIAAASVAQGLALLPAWCVLGLATAGFLLLGGAVAPLIAVVLGVALSVRVKRSSAKRRSRLGDDLGAAERVGMVVTIQYVTQGAAAAAVGLIASGIGTVAAFTLVIATCLLVLWLGRAPLRKAAATVASGRS